MPIGSVVMLGENKDYDEVCMTDVIIYEWKHSGTREYIFEISNASDVHKLKVMVCWNLSLQWMFAVWIWYGRKLILHSIVQFVYEAFWDK